MREVLATSDHVMQRSCSAGHFRHQGFPFQTSAIETKKTKTIFLDRNKFKLFHLVHFQGTCWYKYSRMNVTKNGRTPNMLYTPNVATEWLAFQLRIREVPGSYLSLQQAIPTVAFLSPSMYMKNSTLHQATTASFHILSNSFFINHH